MSVCFRGCQMVHFKTKNPKLGKFWRVLKCKMLAIWQNFSPFGNVDSRKIWQPWCDQALMIQCPNLTGT
jgi:hypothetical protein